MTDRDDIRDAVHAWMKHQGYTTDDIEVGETDTHEASGCEWCPNHMTWDCIDGETGLSRHPMWDALEEAVAFVLVLDELGWRKVDPDAETVSTCTNCGTRITFNGHTWAHSDMHTVCNWHPGMTPTTRVATPIDPAAETREWGVRRPEKFSGTVAPMSSRRYAETVAESWGEGNVVVSRRVHIGPWEAEQ